MTVRVTYQKDGKSVRREYKTYSRALASLKKWFSTNNGITLLYQPGKEPAVYKNKQELPIPRGKAPTNFYRTKAWRELRLAVLLASNSKCMICGASAKSGVTLHVDHIKPRSLYPDLALEASNLQVLCEDCNLGKATAEL